MFFIRAKVIHNVYFVLLFVINMKFCQTKRFFPYPLYGLVLTEQDEKGECAGLDKKIFVNFRLHFFL